ncbi:MAG: recombination protein RuvA domain [Armatimonadetes bacterium]|jgi:Holliday junction DNA helicase RuvA|nr:recombination protein RuvA domain [Armatimonadota bacterium]
MIAYLRGIARHLDESLVVLDVGGVGYEVLLPGIEAKALRSRLYRDLTADAASGAAAGAEAVLAASSTPVPAEREVALWIYYHVAERQPRPLLIGFHERQDREFFELLLSVADIGPSVAARSLTIPVCDYASAIERRDVRTLGTLPGIGKRKADQIVATLKGKVLSYALLPPPEIEEVPEAAPLDFVGDVEAVLEGLGHKRVEAVRMIEAARRRRPEINTAQELLEEIWRGEQPG